MRLYGTAEDSIWLTASSLLCDIHRGSNSDVQSMGGVCVDKIQSIGQRSILSISAHNRSTEMSILQIIERATAQKKVLLFLYLH